MRWFSIRHEDECNAQITTLGCVFEDKGKLLGAKRDAINLEKRSLGRILLKAQVICFHVVDSSDKI